MTDGEAEAFRAGMASVTRSVQRALTLEYESVRSDYWMRARLWAMAGALRTLGVAVELPRPDPPSVGCGPGRV